MAKLRAWAVSWSVTRNSWSAGRSATTMLAWPSAADSDRGSVIVGAAVGNAARTVPGDPHAERAVQALVDLVHDQRAAPHPGAEVGVALLRRNPAEQIAVVVVGGRSRRIVGAAVEGVVDRGGPRARQRLAAAVDGLAAVAVLGGQQIPAITHPKQVGHLVHRVQVRCPPSKVQCSSSVEVYQTVRPLTPITSSSLRAPRINTKRSCSSSRRTKGSRQLSGSKPRLRSDELAGERGPVLQVVADGVHQNVRRLAGARVLAVVAGLER